jgi:hypothetical protein
MLINSGILVLIMLIVVVLASILVSKFFGPFPFGVNIFLGMFVGVIVISILNPYIKDDDRKKRDEWENKIKNEYIEELTTEKREVIKYMLMNSKVSKVDKTFFTKKPSKNAATVSITFYDNEQKERTEEVEANIVKVKNLQKPYIEYKYLKEKMPEMKNITVFKVGYYNTTLYIPK